MPKRSPATLAATGHPIQVVTRRTGLSADVIRAWEKRYGLVAPLRTATGRRLYSDADVERLRLLARATLGGRPIGQVAALSSEALAALVEDGAAAAHRERRHGDGNGAPPSTAPDHAGACLAAIERFDGAALDAVLRRAIVALSAAAFLDTLVVPLTERVAERVRVGTLPASHGHLTHAVLRRVLDHVVAVAAAPLDSPDLVVTTPSGQSQELGALIAAAAAAGEGWRVTYVGPGLPAEDVAETVAHAGAAAVTLSLGAAPSDRAIPRELRRLRALLPPDVAILVEGPATAAHQAVLREIRATVLRDLPDLRAALHALRDDA